jgi:hypothetical protein
MNETGYWKRLHDQYEQAGYLGALFQSGVCRTCDFFPYHGDSMVCKACVDNKNWVSAVWLDDLKAKDAEIAEIATMKESYDCLVNWLLRVVGTRIGENAPDIMTAVKQIEAWKHARPDIPYILDRKMENCPKCGRVFDVDNQIMRNALETHMETCEGTRKSKKKSASRRT